MLSVHSLICSRAGRALFTPLHFTLPAGSLLYVRGENGAGKSTLLRTLAGLCPVYEGTVTISENTRPFYLGHKDGLLADLTAAEHLHFFEKIYGVKRAEADKIFGLDAFLEKPVRSLSAGQKRRIALTQLCYTPAKIWLLDEPHTSLDSAGTRLLDALIDKHRSAGGAVIIARHGGEGSVESTTITLQKAWSC